MSYWTTPEAFLGNTLGKSYDMDNQYGKTCWDYADFYWLKQVGRSLSTGGTGQARGCWSVASARKANAGTEFELITDKSKLRIGDCVITNGGKYGHVGFVYEVKGNNVVILQGQNQGTIRTKVTRIDFGLGDFLGAFRYKAWASKPSFLPARGYWTKGDSDERIAKLCDFYANNFYGYFCKTKQEAHNLLDGPYFGNNCLKWTKEFQKRVHIQSDGNIGPITYNKLQQFGFTG